MGNPSIDVSATVSHGIVSQAMLLAGEVPHWLSRVFFWPGDTAIELLHTYALSETGLLWLNNLHAGSLASAVLSAVVWLVVVRILLGTYRVGRALDHALTSGILHFYTVLRLKLRTSLALLREKILTLLGSGSRKRSDAGNPPLPTVSKEQLLVLNLHAALPPAHSLPLGKIAAELSWGRNHAETIVATLTRLHLLSTTLSGDYGDEAFILTRKGRACLATRHAKSQLADE